VALFATVNHTGARDDVDFRDFPSTRTGLPSYTTVDAALEAPVLSRGGNAPGIDLTLRAENLLDAAYEQTIGFPGRGRTLLAGARIRF
jgi:outer membrane receptor protein involved in Fe transport